MAASIAEIVAIINALAALVAGWYALRALKWAPKDMTADLLKIAGLAIVYSIAYALVATGVVKNRAAWSEAMAIPTIAVWWAVWITPARRYARFGERIRVLHAENQKLRRAVTDLRCSPR